MNWKPLAALPIAAIFCSTPIDPPKLKSTLPEKSDCPSYESARKFYLLAYAYRTNDPGPSRDLNAKASDLLSLCKPSASVLKERIQALSKEQLPSKEIARHQHP